MNRLRGSPTRTDPVEQELAIIDKKIEVEKAAQQSATITGEIMLGNPETAPKGQERLQQAEERARRVHYLEAQRDVLLRHRQGFSEAH